MTKVIIKSMADYYASTATRRQRRLLRKSVLEYEAKKEARDILKMAIEIERDYGDEDDVASSLAALANIENSLFWAMIKMRTRIQQWTQTFRRPPTIREIFSDRRRE